jgi:hypothetical protein
VTVQEGERWLALEFITVAVVRTIAGLRDEQGLLGPQQYAAMLAAYAMLSMLVMYQPAAMLAAMLGALIVLAVALRPTSGPDGKVKPLGAGAAESISAFARNVGTSPPSLAKGVQ